MPICYTSADSVFQVAAHEEHFGLERLYDLTRMVYADHIADEGEVQLLNRLVVGLGFPTEEAEEVAQKALALVADGRDEDDFIAGF